LVLSMGSISSGRCYKSSESKLFRALAWLSSCKDSYETIPSHAPHSHFLGRQPPERTSSDPALLNDKCAGYTGTLYFFGALVSRSLWLQALLKLIIVAVEAVIDSRPSGLPTPLCSPAWGFLQSAATPRKSPFDLLRIAPRPDLAAQRWTPE
jgi:hypothetical protein